MSEDCKEEIQSLRERIEALEEQIGDNEYAMNWPEALTKIIYTLAVAAVLIALFGRSLFGNS